MHSCQNKSCKAYNISVPSALVLEGNFSCYLCKTPFTEENSSTLNLASKINTEYPSLIARPYAAMLSRTDPESSLKRLLDVFTGLLKLLATIFESEYLHSKKLDETLTEIILKDLKTPTLGKWMYFLHSALNEKKLEDVIFVEYKDYFLKYYTVLSEILSYRNQFYHTFQGSTDKLEKDYKKYKILLDEALNALPLTSQIYIQGKNKSIFAMKGLTPVQQKNSSLKFEDSEAYFHDGKDRQLSLFPLHTADDEENSNSFIYVASTDKRIIYEGLRGQSLDTVRTQKRWKELLIRKTPKRRVLKDDKDRELIVRMQEETRKTLKELFEVGKYISEKYVNRVYPEKEIDRFLQSSMAGLMVIAKSGGGKSSLFSYYADELLKQNVPILFLQGRQLNDESIEAQLQGLLDMDFDLSDAMGTYEFLPDKTFRGILIIDAVNEAQNPERVLQGILKFAEEMKDSESKILFSMREDFWNGIDRKDKEENYPLDYFFTPLGENSEPEKDPRLLLNALTGLERNSLYKNYGGKKKDLKEIENNNRPLWDYLESPLHISFFCAVEDNFKETNTISPDSIGREYYQNIVLQKKQNIADCLRALGFFLRDESRITLEEAWESETIKRFLKDRKPDSPFMQLTKREILREFRTAGDTFIIFTYDMYLEESVGLALLSKPYKGSGKLLAKLNSENRVLQSAISSLLARSTDKKDFREFLFYLDECYTIIPKRDKIQEETIQKLGENSLDLLKELSKIILGRNKDEDWEILHIIAIKFKDFLQYEDSIKLYPDIVRKAELLEVNENIIEIYYNYGLILSSMSQFIKSLEYYEKTLLIISSLYGEDHYLVAMIYNNIGTIDLEKGDTEQAMNNFRKCLKIELSIST